MDYNVKPMIHRFRQNDMNIVMDVNSGIVHVVDDVTYRVLEFYKGEGREEALSALEKRYGAEELNEVMDDLDELIRAQSLYAPMDKIMKWRSKINRLSRRCVSISPTTAISLQVLLCRTGRIWTVAYAHELRCGAPGC